MIPTWRARKDPKAYVVGVIYIPKYIRIIGIRLETSDCTSDLPYNKTCKNHNKNRKSLSLETRDSNFN